jgi:hypothetical protein
VSLPGVSHRTRIGALGGTLVIVARDSRTLVVGGSALAVLGVGWFMLSHVVMGTAGGDALVEALGVVLAVLVLASVVGAVRESRHRPPDGSGGLPES